MNNGHQWSDFDKYSDIMEEYLPVRGQGDTKATQIVTAISKLVYKWYNDGDVFDNTYFLKGWANDLSSYANWLDAYVEGADTILDNIKACETDDDYENLLYNLCKKFAKPEYLAKMDKQKAEGDIYHCEGPYEYKEYVECERCGEIMDRDDIYDMGMCRSCYEEWEEEQEEQEEEETEEDMD